MKMHLFGLCLCGWLLLPLTPAESKTSGDVYLPSQALSAMQQTGKVPELKRPAPNYTAVAPSSAVKPSTATRRATPSARPTRPKKKYREAPIDKILAKQNITPQSREKYKKHIVRSLYLPPSELKAFLQKDWRELDAETRRMQQIKAQWQKQTSVYKMVNYQLINQIDRGITKSRQEYRKRKQNFDALLKKVPSDQNISMIEATDGLFDRIYRMTSTVKQPALDGGKPLDTGKISAFISSNYVNPFPETTRFNYVSVFDHKYNLVFSYERTHIEANRNRRIKAAPSKNPQIDAMFQTLFDGYRADLKRIGYGLDITNPTLLRQLSAMKDQVIKKEY